MWCARPSFSRPLSIGRNGSRAIALIAGIGLALSSTCGKGPGSGAKKIPRDRDAQAVVVVDSPLNQVISFSQEAEPNDDIARATALAVGAGARGSLDGETDVDVYAVTVTKAGLLEARVSGIDGVDLILELRDANDQVVVRSDRGPARIVEGMPNIPVGEGTYYLAISEFVKKSRRTQKRPQKKPVKPATQPVGRQGPSPIYELTVQTSPSPAERHEIERNETADTAAEVPIGEPVFGYMGWHKDVDVWKLSIEGFAAEYSLDLDVDAVPGVIPTLTVRDNAGVLVLRRRGEKDRGLSVRNLVVVREQPDLQNDAGPAHRTDGPNAQPGQAEPGQDEPGDDPSERYYYAALSARRSNPLEPYRLTMTTRLLDVDDEIEPNDDAENAIPLRNTAQENAGMRRGHLTIGDADHYSLAPGSEPILLQITAKPLGGARIEITVLADGQTLAMSDASGAGKTESLADVRIEAGKAALVKIAGRGDVGTDAAYELRWAIDPAGPPRRRSNGDPASDVGLLDAYEEE
ncbi:MAG: hypothetical protein MJE77_31485 [Proteobacteria bacterium]|nr:hypothetical protein [Pseudomonadota bacterium]